ncbi:MAG: DUF1295 domain-containing protein [Paludibacteraceae bacterium]|nr:DUF1295 domain-containing protein [Paludibacteraceae bacterium]
MGKTLLILALLTLLIDSVGWKKFIYFISLGYGYSIAGIGIALIVMHFRALNLLAFALIALLIVYGFRLATYLLRRELKSKAYAKTVSLDAMTNDSYSKGVLSAIWISCVILYICQMFPIIVRVQNMADGVATLQIIGWIGFAVAVLGVLLESWADHQKSAAKKVNPDRFVDTGLYRIVRCPNYLGEVTLWTGVFISGIGCYSAWWHWLLALFGYIGIVYIMFSGARRLEIRQDKNYGEDPEYQAYKKRVPILIPLLPIYSVKRFNWLRG